MMPALSPEEKVARLEAKLKAVEDTIRDKKSRLKEAERLAKKAVQIRLRRARYAASAKERKLETRRNILMGAYVRRHFLVEEEPGLSDRIHSGLDAYLTRPHDRAAFDLAPLPEDPDTRKSLANLDIDRLKDAD